MTMNAIVKKFIFTVFLFSVFVPIRPTMAESQDACAIWLCLPGGFPQGCSGAYSEFKRRIKKGWSPLPDLASCSTGPNGEKSHGRYEMGFERYFPCDEGFVLREKQNDGAFLAACYKQACAPQNYTQNDDFRCESYQAKLRPKPHFVKMWIDGQYLGQYFYQ